MNRITGAPIRNARVWLDTSIQITETDAAGRFRISHLEPGPNALRAGKDGFEDSAESLDLRASREEIILRLTPLSSIRGRVMDSEGDPVEGTTVIALVSRVVEGRRKYVPAGQAVTDDRGQYRIGQLSAGRYLVQAAGFQGLSYGGESASAKTHEAFAPVYFGNSHDAASATPLSVDAGADARADISVIIESSHLIRGNITGLKPYTQPVVQLRRRQEDFGLNRCTLQYGTGRFEIDDVPDGVYHLRVLGLGADDQPALAEQDIEVAGRDVEGVSLPLRPGSAVRGTVRIESSPAESPARIPRSFGLWLEPEENSASAKFGLSHSSEPDENGAFRIVSVLPGKYHVRAAFGGGGQYYIGSMQSGTNDLLANPAIDISPTTAEIEVVLRADSAAIQGALTPELAREDEIGLILVPEALNRPPRLSAAINGTFEFVGIAPGIYRLHAWKSPYEIEYQSPQVLRILAASGVRIEVQPGKQARVELKQFSEMPK